MVPKIKAKKIENGYIVSCNGREFSSTSADGAIAIAQELYCREVAPVKAAELINSLNTLEPENVG